jgi:hypothetical protein
MKASAGWAKLRTLRPGMWNAAHLDKALSSDYAPASGLAYNDKSIFLSVSAPHFGQIGRESGQN